MAINNQINFAATTVGAALNSSVSNVTGDGTLYTVIFDSVQFGNEGGWYNPATGEFSMPTGTYQINVTLFLNNLVASNTQVDVILNYVGVGSLANMYTCNPYVSANPFGDFSISASYSQPLNILAANSIILAVGGNGTPNVGIRGSNTSLPFYSFLSINRIA